MLGNTVAHLQVLGNTVGHLQVLGNTVAHLQAPDTVSQAGSVGKNRAKPVGPLCTSPHCNTVPKTLLQDGSTSTYCRTVPHAPTAGRFHTHLLQDGSTRTSPQDSCWRKAGVIVGTANSKLLFTLTQGLPCHRISLPF